MCLFASCGGSVVRCSGRLPCLFTEFMAFVRGLECSLCGKEICITTQAIDACVAFFKTGGAIALRHQMKYLTDI